MSALKRAMDGGVWTSCRAATILGATREGMRYRARAEQEVVDVIRTANFIEITVTTAHVARGIEVDYAADGRIAGSEILDTRKRFGDPEIFRRVLLEDLVLPKPISGA